jgi:hypothetical protein
MPSPFPGMDPYLEAPDIWPDLHDALAGEMRALLNSTLPAPYYARLEMRPEVGIVEEEGPIRRIVPDVAVARRPGPSAGGGAVVLEAPRSVRSKSITVTVPTEPIRHPFVEIRDPSRGHQLITLIEIVSPSNKRPGADRKVYLQKQREILDSSANLIELDLLRHGQRLLPNIFLEDQIDRLDPAPDYLVLVNRSWLRMGDGSDYEIFPVFLEEPLPCIGVPLRKEQDEVLLDLQFVFNRAYDTGPYRRGLVNYGQPLKPPLEGPLAAWLAERLRQAGSGPTPAQG